MACIQDATLAKCTTECADPQPPADPQQQADGGGEQAQARFSHVLDSEEEYTNEGGVIRWGGACNIASRRAAAVLACSYR